MLPYAVARVRRAAQMGLLYDADTAPGFGVAMLDALRRGDRIKTAEGGEIVFSPSPLLAEQQQIDIADVSRMGAEQSNSSLNLGSRMAMKIYRRLQVGTNPEVEIGRFLTDVAHFKNTPPLLGVVEHVAADGTVTALAVLQTFVRNQGDAWGWTLEALKRVLETIAFTPQTDGAPVSEGFMAYVPHMQRLGRRTAEMHKALATPTDDPAFASEPLALADVETVAADAKRLASRAFARLKSLDASASERAKSSAAALIAREDTCVRVIDALTVAPHGAIKTRVHGDYHLGQVLVVKEDVIIVDFEGEPSRPLDERSAKGSPLRDVAGMLRSFAYAIATAGRDVAGRLPDPGAASGRLTRELAQFSDIFLDAYSEAARGSSIWIEDEGTRKRLLLLHLFAKAFYEIDYEAGNRPDWIDIPTNGVLGLLEQATELA